MKTVVLQILTPLAKIMLRFGVTHQMFVEWSKQAFVKAAKELPNIKNKKQANTAISIITGMHRKEVKSVLDSFSQNANEEESYQTSRVLRVVQGWLSDAHFSDAGTPKIIPFEGENSFIELNRKYSGDMKPKAMLDELLNNQMVAIDAEKRVKLLSVQFMPKGDRGKLEILGFDAAALIQTIDKNLEISGNENLFQQKVYYDHLPKDVLPAFKDLVNRRCLSLLIELDAFLKTHDGDSNKSTIENEKRASAGVGIFYFENTPGDQK